MGRVAPTVRVTISTLPNLPLSQNQRWRLQQYYEHEQGFARPKYACTAGYKCPYSIKRSYSAIIKERVWVRINRGSSSFN